jgi:hypothetical protein
MDLINTDHANLPSKLAQIFQKESLRCDKEDFYLFLLDRFNHLFFNYVTQLRIY